MFATPLCHTTSDSKLLKTRHSGGTRLWTMTSILSKSAHMLGSLFPKRFRRYQLTALLIVGYFLLRRLASRYRQAAYIRLKELREKQKRQHAREAKRLLLECTDPPVVIADGKAKILSDAEALRNAAFAADAAMFDSAPGQDELNLHKLCIASQTSFVSSLDAESFSSLYLKMEKRVFRHGDCLFRAGQPAGQGMWIVSTGRFGLFSINCSDLSEDATPLSEIIAGGSIGEFTLIGRPGQLHEKTCRVLENATSAYFISKAVFEEFCWQHPREFTSWVQTAVARQWRVASYTLHQFLLLPELSRLQHQGPANVGSLGVQIVSNPTDQQHESAEDISKGLNLKFARSRILMPGEALFEKLPEATIEVGTVVGGMSFFGKSTRGETVICPHSSHNITASRSKHIESSSTVVYEIDQVAFERMFAEQPRHVLALVQVVARQLATVCQSFVDYGLQINSSNAREHICQQGEESASLVLLISGRARLFVTTKCERWASEDTLDKGSDLIGSNADRGGNFYNSADIAMFEDDVDESSGNVVEPPTKADVKHTFIADIGRGEALGELSFLSRRNGVRDVSAVCIRHSEYVLFSRTAFENLIKLHPDCMHLFAQALAQRLERTISKRSNTSDKNHSTLGQRMRGFTTIAVVPASPDLPQEYLHAFSAQLTQQLQQFGRALHLDSSSPLDAVQWGRSTSGQYHNKRLNSTWSPGNNEDRHNSEHSIQSAIQEARISQWLTQQEEDFEYVVLEADVPANDDVPSLWSKCCVRQADGVLLVAPATSVSHQVSLHERSLIWYDHNAYAARQGFHCQSEKDLVLLHAYDVHNKLPTNTKRWLERRPVRMHHHIRLDAASTPMDTKLFNFSDPSIRFQPSDMSRLSRFCTGRAVGVVLGGGGSKGLAHLGVIRSMEEAGVPIDCVGGTSQGAFMAALFASRLHSEKMRAPLENFCQSFALSGLLGSATLPLLSYFDGINFSKVVREPFGSEAAIEDLWIPYFCVSTNMSRCQVQVHTQGSLWWHLRASMSVLGYVPPMIDDLTGEVHMDGGYANNLPVDVMSSSAAPPATIIAVDVEDRDISSLQSMHNYGDGISGLTLLINELNPFCTEKVPAFHEVLMWLQGLSHSQHLRSVKPTMMDVYLRPPVQQFSLLDYLKLSDIEQIGYETGKRSKWIQSYSQTIVQQFQAKVSNASFSRLSASHAATAAPLPQRVSSMIAFPRLDALSDQESTGSTSTLSPFSMGLKSLTRSNSLSRLAQIHQNQGDSGFGIMRASMPNLAAVKSD